MRDLNRELAKFSLRPFDKPLLEIKRSAVGTEIRGYASVFGTTDYQGEVVDPGAYTASLARHRRKGTMSLMFWSHNPAEIPGYWTSMVEDHKGLLATGRILPTVQRGKEAIALIEAGAVNGLSVGFRTIRDRIINRRRHLVQLDLVEVSLVSLPSNDGARLMHRQGIVMPITKSNLAESEALLADVMDAVKICVRRCSQRKPFTIRRKPILLFT